MADTYYASVRESATAADKRHMGVFNAAGSGKTLVVYRITAIGSSGTPVAGLIVPLAALRLTAAPTGGAPTTFAKAKPSNPDVPAEITVGAAVTGGTLEGIAFGIGVVSGEETSSAQESVIYEAPIDGSQQVECPEGTGFAVVQFALASAGTVSMVAVIGLIDT